MSEQIICYNLCESWLFVGHMLLDLCLGIPYIAMKRSDENFYAVFQEARQVCLSNLALKWKFRVVQTKQIV